MAGGVVMATSTRKRPMSSAGKKGLGRAVGNAKKGWRRTLRKHPSVGIFAQIVLGLAAVMSLVLGVVLESFLYYLVMALAGLGTLAIRRAQQMEHARQGVPPKPTTGGPRKPTAPPPPAAEPKATSGVVKCTATGKPASECDCYSRHVATQDGVKRYGRPLGTPFGRAKAGTK